jgi:hypothetical protein
LLILIPCSQVYLGNVVAGALPPPPLILPPVTFPQYATHGIPKTHGSTSSSLPKIPKASHSKVAFRTPSSPLHGDEDDELEEVALKRQLLEVTPGSPEAEDLMEILEARVKKLHPKNKTTASLLGIFAKALWKDRQGMFFKCNFYGHM